MSYLAIGSVTKAIVELLHRKLNKPSLLQGSFRVTALAPDDDRVSAQNGVNLYLFRVSENPSFKNMAWSGDRSQPNGSRKPPLALTMNYLLTAYAQKVQDGTVDEITSHQLLGNAMSILHDYPVLNDIHDADFDASLPTQFPAELAQAFEKVKITFLPASMDEFSKIWTGFTKAFRLSVVYDVSLIQIAPLAPSPSSHPNPQRTVVRVQPFQGPIVSSLNPGTGPTGSTVTIIGSGFVTGGQQPGVSIGGVDLAATDLTSVSATAIVFAVPAALALGPATPVSVSVGGLSSNSVSFTVDPWIASLTPLRGIVGTPIEIPFTVPTGVIPSVEIDGTGVAATVDATKGVVRAIVPVIIASNGPKTVDVLLPGPPAVRTNAQVYEVFPAISSFTSTAAGNPVETTVTVTGNRLSGTDVFVNFGSLSARVDTSLATNTNTSVAVVFDRPLPASGIVTVMVDGRASNPLPRQLVSIAPAQGSAGDTVILNGTELNGASVTVTFDSTDVAVGPQGFSSRFAAAVPNGLAAGQVNVHVTVDGAVTNDVPFDVLT